MSKHLLSPSQTKGSFQGTYHLLLLLSNMVHLYSQQHGVEALMVWLVFYLVSQDMYRHRHSYCQMPLLLIDCH